MGKQGTDAQYAAGILLKLNLKLGGVNQLAVGGPPLMGAMPTQVFGIDVNHAAPGSQNASYVAIVASLDERCVKWHTIVAAQEQRTEVVKDTKGIDGMIERVRQCLRRCEVRCEVRCTV